MIYESPNNIKFVFKSETVQVSVENNPEDFLTPIVTHLYSLFGPNLPLYLTISPFSIKPPEEPYKFKLVALFCSYCISKALPENEILLESLYEIEQNEFLNIDLLRLKPDIKYVSAIISALWFSNNLRSLNISQSSADHFFDFLAHVIQKNCSCFESLKIYNCTNFAKFETFMASTCKSTYFQSLSFYDTIIPIQVSECFSDHLLASNITELSFIQCPFEEGVLSHMKENAQSYAKINHFSIEETASFSNKDELNSLMCFLAESKISSVSLIDIDIDISEVFSALKEMEIQIISLDLSKNKCSSKFSGMYSLPISLFNIKLSKVQWSATALYNLLIYQDYVNPVSLDLSSQYEMADGISNDGVQGLVEMQGILKPINVNLNISSLIWDDNTLTTGFFNYVNSMKHIHKLSINRCVCEKKDLTVKNAIVLYLQNSRIEELSIGGSPVSPYKDLVQGLFAVFAAHQTLHVLDVSNNNIGDVGLDLLVDCVVRNKNIQQISFDGSRLTNPVMFIDCCRRLYQADNLSYVVKPKREIIELSKLEEVYSLQPGAVVNAWKALKEKCNKPQNGSLLFEIDNSSNDHLIDQMTSLNASWEIDIKIPFNREPSRWDPLRNMFSLEQLTGIPPDEQESLISF
ncbi:hypothetical protein TRFO_13534 [Tritrichomonas foetus]|uniref:Leucine Rich Repeat family protein n=1 Tax=Tritrichomonas foetus TaxID=1144522 RepID=A0A1J4KXQ8_9EUKA|nr:hypothetical protein TRFO_13534 [Tritrichomonas foetus]|eukprot:OHT16041.1 hypothetical protein TRFO_13534 [Tritrichomonas foetus]